MATTVQGLAPRRAAVAPAPVPPRRTGPADAPRPGASRADHLLLLLMALIWGVNYSVLKIGTRAVDPVAFNGARLLLATVVLAAVAAVRRGGARPTRADAIRLVLLGVLGHGVYQFFFIEGLARTAAGTTALIMAGSPAFVGVVGRLLRVERPSARAWGGIALQLTGVGGVVLGASATPAAPGAGAGTRLVGVVLILAASLAWSFYAVLLKPYAERLDGVQVSAWTLTGGALMLCLVAVPPAVRGAFAHVTVPVLGALFYCGVISIALAYLFYYRGLRTVGPVRTAMYSNLQPVVALAVAFVVLGERPGAWQIAGAGLIAAGLAASHERA